MDSITYQREIEARKLTTLYHAIRDGKYDHLYTPEQRGELLFLIGVTIRTLRGPSTLPETVAMVASLLALSNQLDQE